MVKSLKKPLADLRDIFDQEVPFGEVIGSLSSDKAIRWGVDREAKISVDKGALRLSPLDQPGWGRQALAYGPFERRAGLTFATFMLNGHNNSQTFEPKPRNPKTTQSEDTHSSPWSKGALRAHFGEQKLKENLVVGWFDQLLPNNPLEQSHAFVVKGNGKSNGELWANMMQGMHPLLTGLANNPVYFVSVVRESGVAFYAGSIEGSRHLPKLPKLRPIAIDPYGPIADELYAGIHQGVLGEVGCRVDTRVYGVRVTEIPQWRKWYGTAHAADRQPQLGRKAAIGGTWQLAGQGMVLFPEASTGLLHARFTPPINPEDNSLLSPANVRRSGKLKTPAVSSLLWRYQDADNYLALELAEVSRKRGREEGNLLESRLRLRHNGQDFVLATQRGLVDLAGQPHWVHVLDDGETIAILVDGKTLFEPIRESRLTEATGIALRGQIGDFEAHPRCVDLPNELDLGYPWEKRGEQVVFLQDFTRWYELPSPWERNLGKVLLHPVKEGLRVSKPQKERAILTIPWLEPTLADLEIEILPPGKPGQDQQSQAGLCFWQDDRHYLLINLDLDDSQSSVAAHLRFAGFESVYDHIWTKVPHLLKHGSIAPLRVVCDGLHFQVYLGNEAILYRALNDIYPGAEQLEIKRVGLAISGYGMDTGSIFRKFTTRR